MKPWKQDASPHTTKCNIIKVDGCLDGLYFSANVEFLDFSSKVGNRRVGRVVGAKDLDGFFDKIGLINVVD